MTSRLAAALVCAAASLIFAPAAGAVTRAVAPSGIDEGGCVQTPCKSWGYAYQQSVAGDVIEIGPGVHTAQVVPTGTTAVTFKGRPDAEVRKLDNWASNVTFDGIDVDADFTTPVGAAFENHPEAPGGRNVTFKNGRIGNVVDEKGALFGGHLSTEPLNLVIDNVDFHDVVQRTEGVHNECVFSQAPGLTIRNSRFTNCATMDLFLVRGDWWGQPMYGGVTLENNVFGHSVNESGWHAYSVYFSIGKFENIRVVNNTFENAVNLDNLGIGPYSGVWANNIGGGWECLPGVNYRGNVGEKCHTSDKRLSPSFSCGPPTCPSSRPMPVGWVDPGKNDFHLVAASPARGAADPQFAPLTDIDGVPRGSRPDAGAYQHPGELSGPVCAPLDAGELPKATATVVNVLCAGRDLSFAIAQHPAHGTASVDSSGAVTYTGREGYVGPDQLSVRAWEPNGSSATADVSLKVANHAPICTPIDFGRVGRDSITPAVMDCTDADGDPLEYFLTKQPGTGAVTINSVGRQLTYYAPSMFAGTVEFAYAANDGTVTSEPVKVTVDVANSVPECPAVSEQIRTGKPWTVLLDCSDADVDPLTYSIAAPPEHGAVEIISDDFSTSLVYTPAAGYIGADRVKVRAFDGAAESEPAEIAFDVTANHAPACEQRVRHTRVGAPAAVRIECSDPDRQDAELQWTVATSPGHGTLTGLPDGPASDVSISYGPAAGFVGADQFAITASDGTLAATTTTRMHVADTPYCAAVPPLALERGASAEVALTCTQPPGDAGTLTYAVVTPPTRGTVTGSGPEFTYTAGAQGGADSFAVSATGASGTSNAVTQSVTVAHAAPECAPQELSVVQDQVLDVPLSCADPAGGDPQLEIVDAPPASEGTLGTVDQSEHRVRFTPKPGFAGTTSFTFRARRADAASEPALVRITVSKANQAPTASIGGPDEAFRKTPVALTATFGDPDGTIAFTGWDLDDDGAFDDGSSASASPTFAQPGSYVVRFRVLDDGGKEAIAAKTIRVLNRAPTANVQGPTTGYRGEALTFTAQVSDPDGAEGLTRAWDTDGDGFDDGGGESVSATFTSPGAKTVRLRVTDDAGEAITASHTVTVANRAPTASVGGPARSFRGVAVELTGAGTDPDGAGTIAKLEWDIDGDGFDDGEGAALTVTFTSLGAKTIKLRATDDEGATHVAEHIVQVDNRDPAAAIEGPATAGRGESVTFTAKPSDPDGPTGLAWSWDLDGDGFDDGTGATATTAFAGAGTKTVRLRVTDDAGATAVANHTVTVGNRAPSASIAGATQTVRGAIVALTGAATDPDGAATVASLAWDTDGDGFDDGTGTTLQASFATLGRKTVRLRATDDEGASHVAEHAVDVLNRAPTASVAGPGRVVSGNAVTLTATAGDPDGAGTITKLEWDTDGDGFDDGTGPALTTTFSGAGTKTIRLRATDDAGAAAIAEHAVEVVEPEAPPIVEDPPPVLNPSVVPPADTAAPAFTTGAKKQKLSAAAKGLKVTLSSSEPANVTITVTVDKATARRLGLGKTTTLFKQAKSLPGGATSLTLKFSSKVSKALARSKRAVKLKVVVTGTDAAGNRAARTLPLTLAR